MKSDYKNEWEKAMNEELESIQENQTWELKDLPPNRSSIGSKWVFKMKRDENGNVSRFKARLVAQGFTQKFGVDYDEVFAPVARSTTLRLLLSISGKLNLKVNHFDVKTAFLNGNLDEEIYMRPPAGMETHGKVYKLNKSLYGLKQAARVWNETFNKELVNIGFQQNETDKCLYVLREQKNICYLLIHVDDILLAYNNEEQMKYFVNKTNKIFEMKDLGTAKHYLGIDISKDEEGNFMISQSSYIEKIITEASLGDAKVSKYPLDPGYFKILDDKLLENNKEYRKIIGMLLFLTTHSRPDIASSVSILSQKVEKPNQTDLNELKRIVRYLKGTKSLSLKLSKSLGAPKIISYSDANWAEEKGGRKSNSGYICLFFGGTISWSCKKQEIVTLSTTEAEYVALSETIKETIWIERLVNFFEFDTKNEITVLTDS